MATTKRPKPAAAAAPDDLFVPTPVQEAGIAVMLRNRYSGLFMRPGRGKTSTTLAGFCLLHERKEVRAMLVLCPKRVMETVWPDEVRKWRDFRHLRVEVLHGSKKDDALDREADVYVMNFEGLPWLIKRLQPMPRLPFDMLVVDESTKVKDTRTARFKLLRSFIVLFRRRYILTGTLVPNKLLDLFGQCFVMDRGAALGRYITHYRERFFITTGFGGYDWQPKPGAFDAILKLLAVKGVHVVNEDDPNLPPLTFNTIPVDLPGTARRVYNQAEQDMVVAFQRGVITSANAAVKTIKLRQIATGWVYLEDDDNQRTGVQEIHTAKLEALEDLFEEAGDTPILLVYQFEHEVAALKALISKFYGIKPDAIRQLGGKQKFSTESIREDWNAGRLPVLLVSPKSASHGLNMQETHATVVWFAHTWSYEEYDQLIRRVWRTGQRGRVVVHHIVARDTIEEVMISVVRSKEKGNNAFMNALAEYARKIGAR